MGGCALGSWQRVTNSVMTRNDLLGDAFMVFLTISESLCDGLICWWSDYRVTSSQQKSHAIRNEPCLDEPWGTWPGNKAEFESWPLFFFFSSSFLQPHQPHNREINEYLLFLRSPTSHSHKILLRLVKLCLQPRKSPADH